MHPLEVRVPAFLDAHPEWLSAAQAHLRACYPQEGCGIFVATGFIPIDNVHPDPHNGFEMPPDVFIEHEVLGVIHSHPDGNRFPSAADMRQQRATDVPWGIAVTTEQDCGQPVWFGDAMPRAPLIGRPFVYGIFDCYSLIRDWYWLERGVDLPEFPRDWGWWQDGSGNMYEEHFAEAGFYEIDAATEPLQFGDMFLVKLRAPVLNHGGLYVEGGLLHHLQFSLSRRSPMEAWAPRIEKWLRHRG